MAKRKGTRADAVRGAVDQTFQAATGLGGRAAVTRERAAELVDELTHAAGWVRETLDDLRPVSGEGLRGLERRLAQLERRVAELEGPRPAETEPPAPPPKPKPRPKPKSKPQPKPEPTAAARPKPRTQASPAKPKPDGGSGRPAR